jgi:hypothetical protein
LFHGVQLDFSCQAREFTHQLHPIELRRNLFFEQFNLLGQTSVFFLETLYLLGDLFVLGFLGYQIFQLRLRFPDLRLIGRNPF